MKFPKLTNPILTMIISYIPVVAPFLIVCTYLLTFTDGEMNLPRIFALFGSLGIPLIFIIKNFGFYLFSEVILLEIRAWQRARQYFESDVNGRDLNFAEKRIAGRCSLLGKNISPAVKHENLVLFRLDRKPSFTNNWSRFDKYFLIYSVPFLDEKIYAEIIASAKANIKAESKPFKPTIFTDKRQKNAPICKCSVVVILAESISPYVSEKVQVSTQNKYDGCFMPCIADLGKGRYYFDSHEELCIGEVIPEKNRAISMIKKYVFCGKLPLENNDRMLPCEIDSEFFEMTLWDLIKHYKKGMKEGNEETGKFIDKMKTDEVKLDESLVFYKMQNKTAVFFASENEEKPKQIEVNLDVQYEYPHKGKFTMSEMNKIKKRIKEELTKMGYEVSFCEEMLPKSYRENKY